MQIGIYSIKFSKFGREGVETEPSFNPDKFALISFNPKNNNCITQYTSSKKIGKWDNFFKTN